MTEPTLEHVQTYWNTHPAGYAEVAHLTEDRRLFFDERDRQTEALYPTLAADYDFAAAQGHLTLEVGCGMGYNAQCLAQQGTRLVVIDLAPKAIQLTRERFVLRGLPGDFVVADAEHLPFKTGAFERVYSSGVIHHSPDTNAAAREITRVLAADGHATVMVYHRNSIWYWWNIVIVLGGLMWLLNTLPAGLRDRLTNTRPTWRDLMLPPGERLTLNHVIRAGTDFGGLQNPLSRVYTKRQAKQLFAGLCSFRFVTQFNRYRALDAHPSQLTRLIRAVLTWLDRRWGWFLIVHADKPKHTHPSH